MSGVLLHCLEQTRLCHLPVLFVAVVGEWIDANASAWGEYASDFDVAGVHQFDEVFHYDVDTVLVEVALVAERKKVELEAFAFNHVFARDVLDYDFREVGLPGFRA